MKRNKLFAILALVLAIAGLAACNKSTGTDEETPDAAQTENTADNQDATGEEESEAPADVEDVTADDTLVVGAPELNGSYIDGFGNSTYDVWVKRLIGTYDGILSYNTYYTDEANEWKLNETSMAKEPEIVENEDGSKTYTFTIADNLVWNDDTPITAKDYVFRVLFTSSQDWLKSGANNSTTYENLVGFEEYNQGESEDFAGIQLIDDKTFSATIKAEKVPYYFEESFVTIGPVPAHRYAPHLDVEGSKLVVAEGYEITDADKEELANNQQLAVDDAKEQFEEASQAALEADVSQADIDEALAGDYNAAFEAYNNAEEGKEPEITADLAAVLEAKINLDEAEELLAGYQDGSIDMNPKELLLASAVNDIVYTYRFNPDVTYGPYNFVALENNMAKVELNPKYVGNAEGDKPSIQKVIVQTVNRQLDVDLAISGTIDYVSGVIEGEKIDKARSNDAVGFVDYPRNGYGLLQIICDQGATQYPGVRQAIAYSLDRNEFVQNIQGGYGTVLNGAYGLAEFEYLEKGAEFEENATVYTLNSQAANAALDTTPYLYEKDGTTPWDPAKAQAAYDADKEGFDYWRYDENGKELRVIHDGSTENEVSDLITIQLPDNSKLSGMHYIVNQVPFNTLLDHYYFPDKNDQDAPTVFNMGTSFDTPHDNYSSYHSSQIGGGDNTNRINDPEADKILEEARHITPDETDKWLDGWVKFNLWYNENLPNIPLYANQYHDIYSNRVGNVTVTPFHDWSLRICDLTLGE